MIATLILVWLVGWQGAPQAPRDTTPAAAAAGTAALSGRVVTDDADARPVREARVLLQGVPGGREAFTDADGRFAFPSLPAAKVTLTVAKPAYVTGAYGASRPGRPGTTIVLTAGQRAEVVVPIVRGAVITGTVRDARARPLAGVEVGVIASGESRPSYSGAATRTDDRGEYRLFGLPAGTYYVAATRVSAGQAPAAGRRSVEENDALLAELQRRGAGAGVTALRPGDPLPPAPTVTYTPVFHPASPRADAATPVTVTAGAERQGVDITLMPVPTSVIEGTVSGAVNHLDRVSLSLVIDGPDFPAFTVSRPVLTQAPDAAGRFRYENVAPGRYTILARAEPGEGTPVAPPGGAGAATFTSSFGGSAQASASAPDGLEYLYGRVDVDAGGAPVSTTALPLSPGATFSGAVVFDRHTAAVPESLTGIRIAVGTAQPTSMSSSNNTTIGNMLHSGVSTAVHADGTWVAKGVPPSTFNLTASVPAEISRTWWLRSATWNGRDLLDGPIDVPAGQDMPGIVFTFSDLHSELAGSLTAANGRAATEYFVVVMPKSSDLWLPGSRRIKSLRPQSNGAFSITDLPAGEYLVAAVTDVVPSDLTDRAWLAAVAAGGLIVTVAEGQRTVQDLRVGGVY